MEIKSLVKRLMALGLPIAPALKWSEPCHVFEDGPLRGKGRNKQAHKPSGVAKMRRAARKARNLKRK